MSFERPAGAGWLTSCAQGLQALGFTDYEARAYVALLQCHPATAYEVSKLSGLPRANAYSVFESLTKKMAAQPVSENPVRYVAVDPKKLLDRIAEDTTSRCHALAEKLVPVRKANDREYVWMVEGEEDIHARIETLIGRARRHVWIKAPEQVLYRHLDSLAEAADREVDIVIVVFGEPAARERLQVGSTVHVYLHEGSGVPVGLADHLVTMSIDFEEALLVDTSEGGQGAYTRSWPIVNMADTLIRHEVYVTEIFQRFGSEIEKAFGPALLSLRRKHLPPEQVAALEAQLGLRESPRDGRAGADPAALVGSAQPTKSHVPTVQAGTS